MIADGSRPKSACHPNFQRGRARAREGRLAALIIARGFGMSAPATGFCYLTSNADLAVQFEQRDRHDWVSDADSLQVWKAAWYFVEVRTVGGTREAFARYDLAAILFRLGSVRGATVATLRSELEPNAVNRAVSALRDGCGAGLRFAASVCTLQ